MWLPPAMGKQQIIAKSQVNINSASTSCTGQQRASGLVVFFWYKKLDSKCSEKLNHFNLLPQMNMEFGAKEFINHRNTEKKCSNSA